MFKRLFHELTNIWLRFLKFNYWCKLLANALKIKGDCLFVNNFMVIIYIDSSLNIDPFIKDPHIYLGDNHSFDD